MSDLKAQLDLLRRKIAKVDRKFAGPPKPPEPKIGAPYPDMNPARYFIEEWHSGQEVQTDYGCHFETEKLYERHRRYGSLDISSLCDLPHDLLGSLSADECKPSHPFRWAFLDTETTGLAGGSGTYAFLVGVGKITAEGFKLRQFFMRDLGEEASLLAGIANFLSDCDTLVTYNGKAYDQPLLETRYRMQRIKPPFGALDHLDLLFGARRLWKLRFDSCRLVELENQILGVEREGDLPGQMIPYVYFDYLRTKQAFRVVPILHHNALDILTLACLTAIVPWAFKSPEDAPLAHGAEMVGLGRWLMKVDQHEKALVLFRRALGKKMPDDLVFRTLWDVARVEKKLGRDAAALECYTELAGCRNPHRLQALEELAKHYEHREKNYAMALEFTMAGLELSDEPELLHRRDRLQRRLAKRAAAGAKLL